MNLTFHLQARYQFEMRSGSPLLPPLSLEFTLTSSIVAVAVLFACSKPVSTIDLSMFLQMGSWMWTHGRLLEVEPFATAALGQSYINGTWLSQLVLHGVFLLGGYPALQLLLGLTVLLTLATISLLCKPFGPRITVIGTCVAFAFLLQNMAIRPQMFSFPLFAAILWLLLRHPNHPATPPTLAALMALWTNLHGAFPVAMAFPAAFAAQAGLEQRLQRPSTTGATWQRWVLLGSVMAAATLVNPYGITIYRYFIENSSLPATRRLSEWLPPSPSSFLGGRFFLGAAVVTGLLVWKRHRLRLCDLGLYLVFTVPAFSSQRMIAWWGLVIPTILGRALAEDRKTVVGTDHGKPQRLHSWLGWGMIGFWIAMFAASLPSVLDDRQDDRGDYAGLDDDTPARVVTYLSEGDGGRMFHRLEWGGYLAFRLWPAYQPFIDIRIWIFSDEVWQQYLSASRGDDGWEELMRRYAIDTLVLCLETQSGLIEAARRASDWTETYADDQAVVFVHDPGE